jgi:hypothetical protein
MPGRLACRALCAAKMARQRLILAPAATVTILSRQPSTPALAARLCSNAGARATLGAAWLRLAADRAESLRSQ